MQVERMRETRRLTLPVGLRDHVQGSLRAPLMLVEYGDYECSYCANAYFVIKVVQQRLGERLRFTFRNFPRTNIHPHAELAAEAAEAAGIQGRFWEMHDKLFEHQDSLDRDSVLAYAAQIGLDLRRFEQDLKEHSFASRVREDLVSGKRSGVNATPVFFIGDSLYDGLWDVRSLTTALLKS